MKAGHIPENLLDYEETPGASEVIQQVWDWMKDMEVFVVTGRPFDSYEPSRRWLDEHHLNRLPIYFVDKYGREMFKQDHTYNLTLERTLLHAFLILQSKIHQLRLSMCSIFKRL